MIGARNNYGQPASACIDDIHLYNRLLNNDEIDALYKRPIIRSGDKLVKQGSLVVVY
jgi:hypothetical protein